MRVALVVYGDLDRRSGGNLYDRFLIAELERRGYSVEVVGIRGVRRTYVAEVARGWRATGLDRAQSRLLDQCDLVIEDELVHPTMFRYRSLADRRQSSPPRVCLVHHLRSSEDRGMFDRAISSRIERRYLLGFDAFLFNSETTRRSVAEIIGTQVLAHRPHAIAHPGGDRLPVAEAAHSHGDGFASLESRLLERTRDSEQPLRILFVGNLIARKGLHRLLDALAAETRFDWRLEVVGGAQHDPVYARRQQERARRDPNLAHRVQWHGALEDLALAQRLLESHCLCVPSQWEGFGIVYLEAQYAGVPSIAAATGATWEIVEPGVTGLLVDPMSSAAIADALASLALDRALLQQMSCNCLDRSRDCPSWRDSMAGAVDFLEQLARGAAPTSTAPTSIVPDPIAGSARRWS
jgi:glycosyltransferase involved in cell wall biosynthesis